MQLSSHRSLCMRWGDALLGLILSNLSSYAPLSPRHCLVKWTKGLITIGQRSESQDRGQIGDRQQPAAVHLVTTPDQIQTLCNFMPLRASGSWVPVTRSLRAFGPRLYEGYSFHRTYARNVRFYKLPIIHGWLPIT